MKKRILSVGLWIPSEAVEECEFYEKKSLLDWDIVVFRPDISAFCEDTYGNSLFQGKLCLSETQSFKLKEACAHWRREIKEAVDFGKTVIFYLNDPKEIYVATGKKSYSGTGRNRQETNFVDHYSSYACLPISDKWTVASGEKMLLKSEFRELLGSYWSKFEDFSQYKVVFAETGKPACISTKSGNKVVGLVMRNANSGGSLICLPDLSIDTDQYWSNDNRLPFTEAGAKFGGEYLAELISLDAALRADGRSVEPGWLSDPLFKLSAEVELLEELLLAEAAVEDAQKAKDQVSDKLNGARQIKTLLFETGKPLENSVILALEILGFTATNFLDETSEFDVVFECEEGRLIGEVEGRDSKPIAIGKLRQLSANILEDVEKGESGIPAKGVLFGNGHRLLAPKERMECFSEKCVSSASALGLALVSTTDLFIVSRYVSESRDGDFARQCRLAMLTTSGIVSFPSAPAVESIAPVALKASGP